MSDLDFSDLEDENFGGDPRPRKAFNNNGFEAQLSGETFPCKKCSGTGRWSGGFSTRWFDDGGFQSRATNHGKCFACNGKGHFLTSQSTRNSAKMKRTQKKTAERVSISEEARAFLAANPKIEKWLNEGRSTGFEFAISLCESLFKYGSWTDKQLAAVARCIQKNETRVAERAAQPSSSLDVSPLVLGVQNTYMVPDGDTRLKVAFRKAKRGNWKGWIFVDDGAEYGQRSNYGRQAPNGTYQGKIIEQIKAILADPKEASARYGRETSSCGVCGRMLEDEVSVELGIGPVCRNKF